MRPWICLLATLAILSGAAAPALGRPDAATIFEAPRELRSADDALREATLDEIRDLGAQWLRLVLYWRDVAPLPDAHAVPRFDERDPRGYDWSLYDRIVAAADARGMKVLLTVSGPVPRWATKARRDHVTRPSATRFGRFSEAVGRRYGAIVDAYSIWNEPNHPKYLRPQWTGYRTATSAAIYRRLFQRGERGLAAAGIDSVPVLFGETPRGEPRTSCTPSPSCAARCAWTAATGVSDRAGGCVPTATRITRTRPAGAPGSVRRTATTSRSARCHA